MGLFGNKEKKLNKDREYLKSLSHEDLLKTYDMMKAWPQDKQNPELNKLAEDLLAEMMANEQLKEAGYRSALALSEDSPLKQPTEYVNDTHLGKLDILKSIPRDLNDAVVTKAIGKAPMLGKSSWLEKMKTTPFMYGYVLQANNDLWEPGKESYIPAVFVVSDDKDYACDIPFLTKVTEKVMTLKNSTEVPADCKEFISVLRDSQSEFCFPLGDSITGGISTWCFSFKFEKQTLLPNNCLPYNRIVPFLLIDPFKKQKLVNVRLMDKELYQ